MKKIYMLTSLILVFSGLILADNAMLKISALSGEVDCSIAGADWKPAVLDQALNTNDKVRTRNGRAELLFSEGTTIRIKEGSLLDLMKIQCAGEKQNSFLKLLFGGLKAKVIKLKEGGSFDVATPKIVAAIKGTEFVLDTTNEASMLQVLEGVVALYDILKEKEIFVKENEKAVYKDGLLENPRNMDPGEIRGLREFFDVSYLKNEKKSPYRAIDRETETKEMKDLRNDLAEVKDRSNLEGKQDLLERISDVQLGKTAMDMHGYRVRTDNYVLRPLPNMLQLLNITKREGGPDAGISSFEINDTFNKDLPENYMDVKTAIRDSNKGITLINGNPDYWLNVETAAIRNPHGDVIFDEVILQNPLPNNNIWEQPFTEKFSINNNLKWTHILHNTFQEEYLNASGATTGTALPYSVATSLTSDGGILFKDTYSDSSYLEKYVYLINDSGLVQPLADVGKGNLNWEMIYKAPEFGARSIDLIVLPEIFNELF